MVMALEGTVPDSVVSAFLGRYDVRVLLAYVRSGGQVDVVRLLAAVWM